MILPLTPHRRAVAAVGVLAAAGAALGPASAGVATVDAMFVAGPYAEASGYATRVVVATAGRSATLLNADPIDVHDVRSVDRDADGAHLFRSDEAGTGDVVAVTGVEALGPGAYDFYCSFHPGMRGQLVVDG